MCPSYVVYFSTARLINRKKKKKITLASYDDGLRPGDVYHPDYQLGCPAYLDFSQYHSAIFYFFLCFMRWCGSWLLERLPRMRNIW